MKQKDGKSRRRLERANVRRRLKGVFLRCPAIASGEIRVVNVSELGVGVETSGLAQAPTAGTPFDGRLIVGKSAAPVSLRIVHMNPEVTGLEFIDASGDVRAAVRSYFEAELAGASLRPLNGAPASSLSQPYLRGYADENGNTLEYSFAGQRLQSFRIGILGNSVEWSGPSGNLVLVQNAQKEPVDDYLRGQLVRFVQSADHIDPLPQKQIETVLLTGALP